MVTLRSPEGICLLNVEGGRERNRQATASQSTSASGRLRGGDFGCGSGARVKFCIVPGYLNTCLCTKHYNLQSMLSFLLFQVYRIS